MMLSSGIIDTIPPDVPTNLEGISGDNEITLTWNSNSEDVISHYNIFRSLDPKFNPDTCQFFSTSRENKYIDGNLVNSDRYYYRVLAVDFAENESEYSDSISVFIEVGVKKYDLIINSYDLSQNYPNPFNPSTSIIYSIMEKSHVTLNIFDVLGRKISTIVNKEQPQGKYEIEFDASQLTSGVYFYRIHVYPTNSGSAEFVNTKKMLLLYFTR